MKLVLNNSRDTFKSSENFDSSSFTKKISKNSSFQSKENNENNKSNDNNKNFQNNISNKIQQQKSNTNNNKNISINIENILEDQQSIAKLMKNIFTRVLYINNPFQSYHLFLDKLSPTDFKFYDNQFPPNFNSLIKGYKSSLNNKKNKITLDKYRKIIWKRESELNFFPETNIFPKNGSFSNSKNITQGPYTNNNFLSAIIAMSQYPKIIKKLFISDKKNKNGIFGLKICKNGYLQEIIIDDFFPVLKPNITNINDNNLNKSNYPYCFTHSKDNSLWVQIIEKAFAKVYGSYEILSTKDLEGILKDLSFAPILVLDSLSSDLALNLSLAKENKWIVLACAGDTDASQNLLKELDLKPDFHYEILEVFKLGIEDLAKLNYIQMNNLENVQIILKIRNIWGKIEWEGEWSNSYKFWDDDLKKKLKYDPKDEQAFYMNLRDFKNHFFKIKICKILENAKYKSIKIKQNPNDFVLIKLDIRKPNLIDSNSNRFISLIQEEKENNKFLLSRMILCKVKDTEVKEVEYIKGIMGQEREIFLEQKESVSGGEYLLYCEIDKSDDFANYIVSVYSSEEVNLEEIDNKSYQNILEKIYISCAKKKKQNLNSNSGELSDNDEFNYKSNDNSNNINYRISSFKKIKIINAPKIIKYTESTIEGFSYIYIENLEQDTTLIENANYHNFKGYKLLYPYSGTSFYVEVKPGECKIIIIKRLELIESNNIDVFYRSNLLYGNKTLYELTKKKGRKKKRIDKKTGKKVNINVYIFKHDFGICFLYRNKTNNMVLNEKINIENNTNIDFSEENKKDLQKKEIKISLQPHKDYFLNLKSKYFLWKVNPVFSYTIDIIPNTENEEEEKSESNSPGEEFNNILIDKRKISRVRSMSPSSVKSKRKNDIKENENAFGDEKENDMEENEESIENDGDSSDINISNENSEESL